MMLATLRKCFNQARAGAGLSRAWVAETELGSRRSQRDVRTPVASVRVSTDAFLDANYHAYYALYYGLQQEIDAPV